MMLVTNRVEAWEKLKIIVERKCYHLVRHNQLWRPELHIWSVSRAIFASLGLDGFRSHNAKDVFFTYSCISILVLTCSLLLLSCSTDLGF